MRKNKIILKRFYKSVGDYDILKWKVEKNLITNIRKLSDELGS